MVVPAAAISPAAPSEMTSSATPGRARRGRPEPGPDVPALGRCGVQADEHGLAVRCPCPGGQHRLGSGAGAVLEVAGVQEQVGARGCPGGHLAGPPAQAPLPRRDQEPRLAQAPHRGIEPAQPDRERAGPPRRRLGAGHLTSTATGSGRAASPAGTAQRPGGLRTARPARPPARPRPCTRAPSSGWIEHPTDKYALSCWLFQQAPSCSARQASCRSPGTPGRRRGEVIAHRSRAGTRR